MTTTIPAHMAGYKLNAAGHLVPLDKIDEIDLLRDQLVRELAASAEVTRGLLRAWKQQALDDIGAFISLVGERYDIKVGGQKGNITLTSYDGRIKADISISDSLRFDEKLQIAKQLIDQCIHRWAEASNGNVRALIEHAFQVDKSGRINTGRVLGLIKLKIDDPDWRAAMDALRDSITVTSSKSYLRLYRRDSAEGKWRQICLDIAAL
jgi:hypothetical protein